MLSRQAVSRCDMGELRRVKSHVEGLVQKRRQTEAPKVQEAVFALISESGLEPLDLGFKLLPGYIIPQQIKTKKRAEKAKNASPVIDMKSLEEASIEQLNELLKELAQAERARKIQIQNEYRKRVWKVLKDSGIDSLQIGLEVLDGRYKLRAKYKNPETNEVWAGRGKTPNWLKKFEEQGRNRAEFLEHG